MKRQLVVRVIRTHGVSEFLLHALLLTIPVILLFVSRLGQIDHVNHSFLGQTQAARVVGRDLRIAVVLTLLAHPVNLAIWLDDLGVTVVHAVASLVDCQHAMVARDGFFASVANGTWQGSPSWLSWYDRCWRRGRYLWRWRWLFLLPRWFGDRRCSLVLGLLLGRLIPSGWLQWRQMSDGLIGCDKLTKQLFINPSFPSSASVRRDLLGDFVDILILYCVFAPEPSTAETQCYQHTFALLFRTILDLNHDSLTRRSTGSASPLSCMRGMAEFALEVALALRCLVVIKCRIITIMRNFLMQTRGGVVVGPFLALATRIVAPDLSASRCFLPEVIESYNIGIREVGLHVKAHKAVLGTVLCHALFELCEIDLAQHWLVKMCDAVDL